MRAAHRRVFPFFLAALLLASLPAFPQTRDIKKDDEGSCLRAYAGAWGNIEAGFVPDKTEIVIGEPLFIAFVVRNTGQKPIVFDTGGDNRGSVRHNNFMIVGRVVGGFGAEPPLSDPHNYFHGGGLGRHVVLAPGQAYSEDLLLQHWVPVNDLGAGMDEEPPWSLSVAALYTLQLLDADKKEERKAVAKVPVSSAFLLAVRKRDDASLKAIVGDYAKQAKSDDEARRKRAWVSLSYVDHPDAVAALIDELSRVGDGRVDAEQILYALSRRLDDKRVPAAIAAFVMDPERIKKAAWAAEEASRILGTCDDPKAKEALLYMALHDPTSARRDAVIRLARFPKGEVVPVVRRLLQESKPTDPLRCSAVYTLCELGEPFDRETLLPLIRAWPGTYAGSADASDAASLFRYGSLDDARVLAGFLRDDKDGNVSTFDHYIIRVIVDKGGPKHPYSWVSDRSKADAATLEQNRKTLELYRAWAAGK